MREGALSREISRRAGSIRSMSKKTQPGDQVVITHGDKRVEGTVRRVGCSDPDCPSCEGHWKEEVTPPPTLERRPN